MALNPLPFVAVALISIILTAAVAGEEITEEAFEDFTEDEFGGIDILGDIIDGLIGFAQFIFSFLTFDIPGAPAVIRVPISTIVIGGLGWSVAGLVRGN